MSRFDPSERHSEDLLAAIDDAVHRINHTLREGFKLVALQIAAAQGKPTDNSQAIETEVSKLKDLTDQLHKST